MFSFGYNSRFAWRFALRGVLPVIALMAAWQPLRAHQPHDPMSVVAVSPNYANDQTIFVATGAVTQPLPVGEYLPIVSTNGGLSYTVMPGLPNQQMLSIAISAGYATDGTVFMGGVGGLWMSTNRGASWAAAGGTPLAANVQSISLSPNFTNDGIVFAATTTTLLRSQDHGSTWKALTNPTELTSNISFVAVSSNYSNDRTVLLGSVSNGIFVSGTSGAEWGQPSVEPPLSKVTSIAFSPAYATDETIFATISGSGVYKSTNNGGVWSAVNTGITDLTTTALTLSPYFATDNALWVSTATAGVFVTTNRGTSWAVTGTVPRPLSSQTNVHYTTIAAGSNGGSNVALFVGMFEGLWISSNRGGSWTYCDTIPTRLVRALQLSPDYATDQTVFASTYGGGTLWSTSGGAACPTGPDGTKGCWTFQNTQIPDSYTDANAMAPNWSTNPMAWVGTTQALFRISGGSFVWQQMADCNAITFPRSLGVSPNFADDSTIFIGTHSGQGYPVTVTCDGESVPNRGMFESVNSGFNWEATGIRGKAVDAIAVSPNFAEDKTVFAGSSVNGFFKSTNGGVSFTPITIAANDPGALPVVCSPNYANDQTVFTGTSFSGIFKSTNQGTTWTLLPGTSQLTPLSMAISPNYANDQTLFVGTLQQGLLISTNGGATFSQITTIPGGAGLAYASAVAVSPNYETDQTVFVATYFGIFKSTDAGLTWAYAGEPGRQEEQRQFANGAFFSIIYTGTWNILSDKAASSNQLISTDQPGATASLTFWGSGAEWLGKLSSTGGTAQVTLDGTVVATVNLNSSTTQEQQPIWVQRGLTCGAHTVTFKSTVGAAQNINLDSLDVWQDTCPWASAAIKKQ
jgi:hypothetical protein